jgi:hypothetical protein
MTSKHRLGLVPVITAAVALTAACGSSTSTGSPVSSQTSPTAAGAQPADATARRLVASVKVGAKIGPVAAGGGWIWATNESSTVVGQGSNGTTPSLLRIDPSSGAVSASVALPSDAMGLLVSGGVVHVSLRGTLLDVDPASMHVLGRWAIPGDDVPLSLAAVPGAVWIGFPHSGTMVRFDLARHAVTATVVVASAQAAAADGEGGSPQAMVVAGGSLWATVDATGRLARVDPGSARLLASYPLPGGHAGALAPAADGSLWVIGGDHLVHVDTATGASRVLATTVSNAGPMVLRGNDMWVMGAGPALDHVDLATGRVVETVAITGAVVDMADDGGTLWIASLANNLSRVSLT